MNVTSEILFYLYSVKHPLIQEHTGLLNQPVTSIRRLVPGEEPDKEALYILTVDELKSIEDDGRYQHLLFVAPKGKLPTKKSLQKIKGKNYAFTNAFYTTYELQNALLTIFHDLLRQENELLLAAMDPTRAEEVFRFGAKWFPWEYSVVDIDMRLVYRTENLHKVMGGEKVDRIPAESIESLILSKEFHDAAKEKEVFYQSMTFNDLTAMARNILPENQYAGRVVMFLEEPKKQAPAGTEELFTFYTDCIMEALRRSGRLSTRPQNDPLRGLCRSLLNRESIPDHGIREVLRQAGWDQDHYYSVIDFRFLPDSVWQTQLETTLPYLADELENEWPYSCAVNTGREILFVLNLSLMGTGPNLSGLHQQFSYFVRDHICLAGISPVFRDFSKMADAKACAEAALKIGQEKNPYVWYYLFDEYRFDFMKETLTNALSPDFLSHPAKEMLDDYDREHHTELSKTLQAYLDHDRNMTTAADAIFVHRTTFCRRMDHIRKMTGIDLEDADTLILLELSYRM